MPEFSSVREAKEFLIEKIIFEANRESVTLSDLERKLLYFSETGWTLPDILEVNEAFDREYDQDQYEAKVAGLVRGFRKYAEGHSSVDLKSWDEAERVLREEDHYLLVMIDIASSSRRHWFLTKSDEYDFTKLILMGGAGFVVCAAMLMVYMWMKN